MKIIKLDIVGSTHNYLKEYIKSNSYEEIVCVATQNQTEGIGSRGNSWVGCEGNLFFSFVISKAQLPDDLALQSASIYFSYLLKMVLMETGSKVWIKWPNDFYIEDKKIGGTITTLHGDVLCCGIGINLIDKDFEENLDNTLNYGYLDVKIDIDTLLEDYFKILKKSFSWKHIFSLFDVEFQKSKKYKTMHKNQKVSLKDAVLLEDGAVLIDGGKVYSLR